MSKRMGLLREILPQIPVVGALIVELGDPADISKEVKEAARSFGWSVRTVEVGTERNFAPRPPCGLRRVDLGAKAALGVWEL